MDYLGIICFIFPICGRVDVFDDGVLEWTGDEFAEKLIELYNEANEDWLLMEFYSPTCGHCRNFASQFKEIFEHYKGSSVKVARLNCNTYYTMCNEWAVKGFPTLRFGPTEGWKALADLAESKDFKSPLFKSGNGKEPTKDSLGIFRLKRKGLKTATAIIGALEEKKGTWMKEYAPHLKSLEYFQANGDLAPPPIRKKRKKASLRSSTKINSDSGLPELESNLDPLSGKTVGMVQSDKSKELDQNSWIELKGVQRDEPSAYDLEDIERATILLLQQAKVKVDRDITLLHKLRPFLELLCRAYPDQSCRLELCRISINARSTEAFVLPKNNDEIFSGNKDVESGAICGHSFSALGQKWGQCSGTTKYDRGYTCGLWLLFHTLVVNDISYSSLRHIRQYMEYFFDCDECRDNFLAMSTDIDSVTSSDEAILWLWKAHQSVNVRLSHEEVELTGGPSDPSFPKVLFPLEKHCPQCYSDNDSSNLMNSEEVLQYLKSYYSARPKLLYGKELNSGRPDKELEDLIATSERRVQCWLYFFAAVGLLLLMCYYLRWPAYKKTTKKNPLLPIHTVFKRNHD